MSEVAICQTNATTPHRPTIVGFGGTLRPDSSSEQALRFVLRRIEQRGVKTVFFGGSQLDFPMYDPMRNDQNCAIVDFIDCVRSASGIVISSPCYHGSLSGLLKNALDYVQNTSADAKPYLHGRPVGLIGCGNGYQGPSMVLTQLRGIVHALRGWPTPIGVAINSAVVKFEQDDCVDVSIKSQLDTMAEQLVDFISS